MYGVPRKKGNCGDCGRYIDIAGMYRLVLNRSPDCCGGPPTMCVVRDTQYHWAVCKACYKKRKTDSKPVTQKCKCGRCAGTGRFKGYVCMSCDGTGEVTETVWPKPDPVKGVRECPKW